VVSLVPRSTTGYKLGSLRLPLPYSELAKLQAPGVIPRSPLEPGRQIWSSLSGALFSLPFPCA
jgi:hypothetical protein